MQGILIPPIPLLQLFASDQPYDLLLAHLCDDPRYREFYIQKRQLNPKAYFTLDNSAHEMTEGQGIDRLMSLATDLQVNEVVLPDHLFEAEKTLHNLERALAYLSLDHRASLFRYMIVPQGKDYDSYVWCLRRCLNVYSKFQSRYPLKFRPPVIGVSKDYDEFADMGLEVMLEYEVIPIADTMMSMPLEIHLLGWMRTLWRLKDINENFGPRIRTVDSSRAFTFAMHDIDLTNHLDQQEPSYPGRPEDFFHREWRVDQTEIARRNADIFLSLTKESPAKIAFRESLRRSLQASQELSSLDDLRI